MINAEFILVDKRVYLQVPFTEKTTVADMIRLLRQREKILPDIPVRLMRTGQILDDNKKLADMDRFSFGNIRVVLGISKAKADRERQALNLLRYIRNCQLLGNAYLHLLADTLLTVVESICAADLKQEEIQRIRQYCQCRNALGKSIGIEQRDFLGWVFEAWPIAASIHCTTFGVLEALICESEKFYESKHYEKRKLLRHYYDATFASAILKNGIYEIQIYKKFLQSALYTSWLKQLNTSWLKLFNCINLQPDQPIVRYKISAPTLQCTISKSLDINAATEPEILVIHFFNAKCLKVFCKAINLNGKSDDSCGTEVAISQDSRFYLMLTEAYINKKFIKEFVCRGNRIASYEGVIVDFTALSAEEGFMERFFIDTWLAMPSFWKELALAYISAKKTNDINLSAKELRIHYDSHPNLSIGMLHFVKEQQVLERMLKRCGVDAELVKYVKPHDAELHLVYCMLPYMKQKLLEIKLACEKSAAENYELLGRWRFLHFPFASQPTATSIQWEEICKKTDSIIKIIDTFLPHDCGISSSVSTTFTSKP